MNQRTQDNRLFAIRNALVRQLRQKMLLKAALNQRSKLVTGVVVSCIGLTSLATALLPTQMVSAAPSRSDSTVPDALPTIAPEPIAPEPAVAKVSAAQRLLGQWLTTEPLDGDMVMLVFAPAGKLFILSGTAASGNAIAHQFDYRLDDKSQPMHLDVVLASQATIQTLFEFTPDGELRLQMLGTRPGNTRPQALLDNATLFQKISDTTTPPPGTEVQPFHNQPRSEKLHE